MTDHHLLTSSTTEQQSLSSTNLNQTFFNTEKTRNDSDILHYGNNTDTQQQLPNEIITLIISHIAKQKETLYECALVSKQFHVIANSFLWKVLDLDTIHAERFFAGIADTSTQRLATLTKPIRQLCLTKRFGTDTQLGPLLPHMPQLQHLNMNLTSWKTIKTVQDLPRQCPSLLSLTLTLPYFDATFFAALGRHCLQLGALECSILYHTSFVSLLTACPLQRLKIHGMTSLNQEATKALQSFDLICLDLCVPSVDRLITPLAWPRLTSLKLASCMLLKEATLIGFFETHPHLTHLDLILPAKLTKRTLHVMIQWLPHLAFVSIYGNHRLSDQSVRHWIQHSPSLTCAKFDGCSLSKWGFPESQTSDGIYLDQSAIEKIKSGPPR